VEIEAVAEWGGTVRALVLGGCGFIGSHIVDALLEGGHDVRVLDLAAERFRDALAGVDYRHADLHDKKLLAEVLQGIDVVFHAAHSTVPGSSNLDPEADIASNLIGAVRLLEAMREQGVDRIVYLSSGGTVYGMPETLPVPEDHPLNPICSYGVVKVAIEKYLLMYQRLYGLRPVVLRASNPYGPRQGSVGVQGIIPTFLYAIAEHRPLGVWGDGEIRRDYLHVKDLARLCVLAGASDVTGIFNAGSGTSVSINELVRRMSVLLGVTPTVSYREGRAFDVPDIVLDVHSAGEAFGWRPEIALEEGIPEVWTWLNQHLPFFQHERSS